MKQGNQFDVLLMYPKERINTFYYMIPLGLASIAAVLAENDISVKIIDFNFYNDNIYEDLKRWNPSIVGIGGTTGTRKGSFKLARICKQSIPHTCVVYGGIHASFTAEDTLLHVPEIDYVLKGEGEYSFLALAEIILQKREGYLTDIPGISYRENNKIFHNKAVRIDDLDKLPIPARELCEGEYHIKLDYLGIEAEFIMTSRGCPFACDFCAASRMFPGGIRYRSIENVKKEIDHILSSKKVRALKIFDSTFTASRQHVLDFCTMIKPYNLLWECEVRVDTVDFELMKEMKEAGCCYVDIGLETIDEGILKSIYKTITVAQAENVLSWCKELGIRTKVFFTFGHLEQSYKSCLRDVDYIKRNKDKIDFFATTVGIRIYPGTSLERKAKAAGIIPDDFSWVTFKPSSLRHLLFEFENQLILTQKHLGFFRLGSIVFRLVKNGTVGSLNFITELLLINISKLFRQWPLSLKQCCYRLFQRKK